MVDRLTRIAERSGKVDLHDLVEVVIGGLFHREHLTHARVVDEDIDLTKGVDRLFEHSRRRIAVRAVGDHANRVSAGLFDVGNRTIKALFASRRQNNICALLGE